MAATGLEQFDKSLQTANIWLRELMKRLGSDRHTAWSVLGAVLHTLRDRLTNEQVAHLGNQLPLLVRGLFYDQWHPVAVSKKLRKGEEFLARISERLQTKRLVNTEQAARSVFSVLVAHPKGEIQKILKTLPPEIRALASTEPTELSKESPFAWE
ncbi:MAG: DUF2267 domain-containing protein [Rhodospirillaceae bacterium]|nr:DUF2267 domain-containing protein [Rhodospirillaceae bacterium]